MRKLIIVSGLPSSGKSTIANTLAPAHAICTTDDFPGLYTRENGKVVFHGMEKESEFALPMIVKAHEWNQAKATKLMSEGEPVVVVPNTNTQRWEFQPYLDAAAFHGYEVERIDLFDAGLTDEELAARNANGVTADIIARMRANYVRGEAWKTDNPIPPFRR